MIRAELNKIKWGGSGIEKDTFDFILSNLAPKSRVLEFGSGYCSTAAFSLFYDVTSIDNNFEYQNIYHNVKYVHAPIKNGWYDFSVISDLELTDFELIFIDGPSGEGNRNGILNHLQLFSLNSHFLIHDTNRPPERLLATKIAAKLNRPVEFYSSADSFAFIK